METTVYVIETSDGSRRYEFYCVCAKKEDADARALSLKDIYAYVTVTPYYLL